MNTIGDKIKQIRKSVKMTQVNFSKIIGISQGTLSEIEKEKAKPSFEVLKAISRNFQVNLKWLIEDTSENDKNIIELELLNKFRLLDENIQKEILEFIDFKLSRTNQNITKSH